MFGQINQASSSGMLDPPGLSEPLFEPGPDWTDEMWYLPPGAGLFQTVGENSNVTMTDQGVNVGGVDLLEFMAMDPPTFNNMDTSGY